MTHNLTASTDMAPPSLGKKAVRVGCVILLVLGALAWITGWVVAIVAIFNQFNALDSMLGWILAVAIGLAASIASCVVGFVFIVPMFGNADRYYEGT